MSKPTDPAKVCSVCGHPIARDRFMCTQHWRLVPAPMQSEIYRALRAYTQRRSATAGQQALREYRAATDAATAYVAALPAVTKTNPLPPEAASLLNPEQR